MAIDPSIIGNVMVPRAPQMPDVNAMMQTRTAGMENVYKIERQRAEDAKAAQAAEADETVKALIPAYAYALGNPSDLTGALDLAPPELRGALEPYVAQLQGKPPEQVQAALIGSLASSEVGRAFLEAQGRMQTAEIQRGQLTLAQQKAAREAEAEARGPQMTPYEAAQMAFKEKEFAAKQEQEGKGKADPVAAAKADDTLAKIMGAYRKLNEMGAITSTAQTTGQNLAATLSAKTGSTVGAAVGSESQTQRQIIKNLRQALLNDIKAATGMSSKAIDSNVELQSFLNSLGDPENQSYEAAIATIGELSAKYAGGALSGAAQDALKGKTDLPPAAPGGELRRYDSTGKRIQ